LILKTPFVRQQARKKPNSFAASRSASRECMLTFNPFKMILPNDKLAKKPKKSRNNTKERNASQESTQKIRQSSVSKHKFF